MFKSAEPNLQPIVDYLRAQGATGLRELFGEHSIFLEMVIPSGEQRNLDVSLAFLRRWTRPQIGQYCETSDLVASLENSHTVSIRDDGELGRLEP